LSEAETLRFSKEGALLLMKVKAETIIKRGEEIPSEMIEEW